MFDQHTDKNFSECSKYMLKSITIVCPYETTAFVVTSTREKKCVEVDYQNLIVSFVKEPMFSNLNLLFLHLIKSAKNVLLLLDRCTNREFSGFQI